MIKSVYTTDAESKEHAMYKHKQTIFKQFVIFLLYW